VTAVLLVVREITGMCINNGCNEGEEYIGYYYFVRYHESAQARKAIAQFSNVNVVVEPIIQ